MPSRARRYIGVWVMSCPSSSIAPRIGLHEPRDHVEAGGLARAVGSEQPDRLAAPHADGDAAHDLPSLVGLLQPVDGQNPFARHRPARSVRLGCVRICRRIGPLTGGGGLRARSVRLPAPRQCIPDGGKRAGDCAGNGGPCAAKARAKTAGDRLALTAVPGGLHCCPRLPFTASRPAWFRSRGRSGPSPCRCRRYCRKASRRCCWSSC